MSISENILKNLEDWVESEYLKLSYIIQRLSSEQDIKVSNLHLFDVERHYIEIVLKNWLKESCKNVFDYMDKATDQELLILLNQLDTLQSFKDISHCKTDPGSNSMLKLCGGKHFDLILNQDELFDAPYAIHLVSTCFNQFNTISIKEIFSQFLESFSPKHLNFISTLTDFLSLLNTRPEQPKILNDKSFRDNVENNKKGRDMITMLIQLYHQHFSYFSSNQQPKSDDDLLVESFKSLDRLLIYSLQENDWMDKFQSLTKEICKRFLLPLVKIEEKTEGGRRIVAVSGTVIVLSRIKPELLEQRGKLEADEIQIIGLASIHIDCDLENENWHGMNVVVITDKLFISKRVDWDVSGRNGYSFNHEKAKDGEADTKDGYAGDHGTPGESGGNVYITCTEIINARNWTIKSNGGRGNDGQDGGDGKDGEEGPSADPKPTSEEFDKMFPLPSTSVFNWYSNKKMRIALRLQVSSSNFIFSSTPKDHQDILGDDYFFIKRCYSNNGPVRLTASLWDNNVIILLHDKSNRGEMGGQGGEGGKGGHGGYGGTITIQKLNEEPFIVKGLRIGQDIQSTAVSTGARGLSGFDGRDGKGGNYGRYGKSTGDVGVIDNMNNSHSCLAAGWKMGRNYFGFNEDNRTFFIEFVPMSRDRLVTEHPYTLCNLDGMKDLQYAVLRPETESQCEVTISEVAIRTNKQRSKMKAMKQALKKKAITRQSLCHHLNKITERKLTSQLLFQIISQPNHRDDIDQIWSQVLKEKAAIQSAYILSHQNSLLQNTGNFTADGIHKSIDNLQILPQSPPLPNATKINSLSVIYDNNKETHDNETKILAQIDQSKSSKSLFSDMLMQHMASYLVPQPTFEKDNKSAIHAALGDLDDDLSPGISYCKNAKMSNCLSALESFVRGDPSLFNNEQIKMLIEFSLRLINSPDDMKKFKFALEMRNNYLDKEIKGRFQKSVNSEMWTEFETKIKDSSMTFLAKTSKEKVTDLLRRYLDDEDVKVLDANQETLKDHDNKLEVLINGLNQRNTWIGVWQSTQYQNWIRDYLKFIGTAKLGLPELLYLAQSNQINIRIYENCPEDIRKHFDDHEQTERTFKNLGNFDSDSGSKIGNLNKFILYKGNNVWQSLELNSTTNTYLEGRQQQFNKYQEHYGKKGKADVTDPTLTSLESSTSHHKKLLTWLKDNRINNQETITCIKMINPDYGSTPDDLSKLLLRHFKSSMDEEKIEQLMAAIPLLVERVMDYNKRFIEPIFYLHVVDNLSSIRWEYEFLLFEMEERMELVLDWEDRQRWRNHLFKLDGKKLFLLRNGICASGKLSNVPLIKEKLERTLEVLIEVWDLTDRDIDNLYNLSINDWFFELTNKIWRVKIDQLSTENTPLEEKKEAVYMLVELTNKRGKEFCHRLLKQNNSKCWSDIFKQLKEENSNEDNNSSAEKSRDRNIEEIIAIIECEKDGSISEKVLNELNNIRSKVIAVKQDFKAVTSIHVDYLKNKICQIKKEQKETKKIDQQQFLFTFIYAVQLTMNIKLNNTQQVAIMNFLLFNGKENNILAQVATGEGKSLIVAALAIYNALRNKKVDVITSNNILAKRDSSLSSKDGGLKDLYEIFSIDVAHNCSDKEYDRIKAYDSAVVYGELSNFQRDYLLDKCYGRNIRGDRKFDCVIVDEVDCMLLDRGNNMLYLTHDIPGMEMLESLYVFIWEKIRMTNDDSTRGILAVIKSAVLYDLYGAITLDDLALVHGPLKNRLVEKETLWSHLVKTNIIDQQGRLMIEHLDEITTDKIKYSEELDPKLVFFFRNIFERERHIQVPENLLPFVDRHLYIFLENAVQALTLRADEHYVIDQDRSAISMDLNPQVIIIDPDTGTDQANSQWEGGLHQFLQFKEGCRLTLQSLKSVFISNVTFIKHYKNLAGLSGTLGSQPEREFLNEMYNCDYLTVPTAFPKRFTVHPAIVVKTEKEWLQAIVEETTKIIVEEKRSLVIFCQTIKLAKIVYGFLTSCQVKFQPNNIFSYTRDYQKFSMGNDNKLDIGQVIVATKLAGRGTDIKISSQLCDNGGLHICLTYLPENIRIEEQAMGRAGRKGAPGSSRLVLCEQSESQEGKIFDMKMERNRRELQRISKMPYDFYAKFNKEEKCFDFFWKHYDVLKKRLTDNAQVIDVRVIDIMSNNVLDQWTLWLDQFDDGSTLLETLSLGEVLCKLKSEIIDHFPQDTGNFSQCLLSAARSIEMAKHLATREKKTTVIKASEILDNLIQSKDSCIYPAAHYYRAYIYIKDGGLKNDKKEYIQLLRTTETLLEQQINTQMAYAVIVSQVGNAYSAVNKKEPIEAYKEQKENIVKLLWHYISTIQSILGTQCTVSSLQRVGIDNKEKAEKYFRSLVSGGCIDSQVNKPETDSFQYKALKKIAKEYGVKFKDLYKFINEIKLVNKEHMKTELENAVTINCTRRNYWDYLVKQGAIVQKSSGRNQEVPDLKDTGSKYVLFNPTGEIIQNLKEEKNGLEDFEYAEINITVLETVNLTQFGHITKSDDLRVIDIPENERGKVWQALIDQDIIDQGGSLSSDYEENKKKFKYADCPIYEDAVLSLVERSSVAELIRSEWLAEDDPFRLLNVITYLPLDPYQDLLNDLHAIHIITGHRVTDDENIDLNDKIKAITSISDERTKIELFLRNHRAIYASTETPDISLVNISQDILEKDKDFLQNIMTEFSTFSLRGFSHVIKITEKKWSKKMILRSSLILATGVALVIVSALPYIYLQMNGVVSKGFSFLCKKGAGNIIFAISSLVSGDHVTWADVTNRLFSGETFYVPEQLKPFLNDAKLRFASSFSEYGFKLVGPTFELRQQSCQYNKDNIPVKKSYLTLVGQTKIIERLQRQVNSKVNGILQITCCNLKDEVFKEIETIINNKFSSNEMKETLKNLYRLKDPDVAEYVVHKKINRVTSKWTEAVHSWLTSSVMHSMVNLELDEALEKVVENQPQEMAEDVVKNIKKVLNQINTIDVLSRQTKILCERLDAELLSFISRKVGSNFSRFEVMKSEDFQKKIIIYLKCILREQTEKWMKWLTSEILDKAEDNVAALTNGRLKRIYKTKFDFSNGNFMAEKEQNQKINEQDSFKVHTTQQSDRIQLCVKLMKKTHDPILLAALIREGKIPLEDPFCENGLQNLLNLVQHKYPHLSTINSLMSGEQAANLIETDSSISYAIRVGWRDFNKKKCPFEMFPVFQYGCTDRYCELRGLTEYPGYTLYVKQAFMGKRNADSYDNMRKIFMDRDDCQYVIWLTIKTFLLPVAKRLKSNERRKEFVDAAGKHFQDYSKLIRDDGKFVITSKEADELKKRLEICVS